MSITKSEFDKLIESIQQKELPELYKSISENTIAYSKELRDKGITGDQLTVMLATFASSQSAHSAIVSVLGRIYEITPDPFNPRDFIKLVQ